MMMLQRSVSFELNYITTSSRSANVPYWDFFGWYYEEGKDVGFTCVSNENKTLVLYLCLQLILYLKNKTCAVSNYQHHVDSNTDACGF